MTDETRQDMIAAGVLRPREPSVAERRKIFDALEAEYDVKACSYAGNGSDLILAQKLNVPRAWVSNIRNQFFGELDACEDEARLRAEIEAWLADYKSLKGRWGQMEGLGERLAERLDKLISRRAVRP